MKRKRFAQLLEDSGLPAGVAFVFRSHPALIDMHDAIVKRKEFGEVLQTVVVAGQHFPFYRPAYREIYFTKHETGGGLIQDMFPHLLNAVEWFAGPMTQLIGADADHLALEGITVEDSLNVIGRHGNAMASYSMNLHQAPFESFIQVICEKGTAKFEYTRSRWSAAVKPGDDYSARKQVELERDDLFIQQSVFFLDQLEGKSPPPCSVSDGLNTLKTTLSVLDFVQGREK